MFPYYIVRFKHLMCLYPRQNFFRFHTTQYDLNGHRCCARHNFRIWFPYYIVRFKLTSPDTMLFFILWFPYYIVRFKLFIYFFFIVYIFQFPYYIVRFKPTEMKASMKFLSSFHTTQYDLNQFIYFFINFVFCVSILHSTI